LIFSYKKAVCETDWGKLNPNNSTNCVALIFWLGIWAAFIIGIEPVAELGHAILKDFWP
jgi:hypothetical protein